MKLPGMQPTARPEHPLVAVVIDDMGLNEARSREMLELRGPLTLSFLTYVNDLRTWATRARDAGHEILAHVPMEPLGGDDPGPGCLRVSMNAAEVRRQLAIDLDGWSGYVGANNHMGSRFCQNRGLMDAVMAELKSRRLLWLDSKTTAATEGIAAAEGAHVPCLVRDVFLDNVDDAGAVCARLTELETIGAQRGAAIAIGHPRRSTIAALTLWISTLEDKGLTLAPLTALAGRQAAARR